MRALWIIGAASAAVAAGAILALPTVLASGPTLSSPELQQRMLACGADETYSDTWPVCLQPWWENAVQTGDLATLDEAITEAMSVNPGLEWACHDAGHLAGAALAANQGQHATLLNAVAPSRTCSGGLIHGVLDQFSTTNPDPAQVHAMASTCSQISSELERGLCADGLGHAAWQSTSNTRVAVRWCQNFTVEQDRHSCYGGIMMQLPREYLDGRPPAVDVVQDPQALSNVCADNRDILLGERDAAGCYGMAAQVLGLVPSEVGTTWAQSALDGTADEALWNELTAQWHSTRDLCSTFPRAYQEDCRRTVTINAGVGVPDSFHLRERVCRVWDDPAEQDLCRSGR